MGKTRDPSACMWAGIVVETPRDFHTSSENGVNKKSVLRRLAKDDPGLVIVGHTYGNLQLIAKLAGRGIGKR